MPLQAEADHAVGYIEDKQGDFERSAQTMADAALLAVRAGHDSWPRAPWPTWSTSWARS
ncbi:MAG: hypothetical protein U0168_04445 [Nannocystaceae bacterium]